MSIAKLLRPFCQVPLNKTDHNDYTSRAKVILAFCQMKEFVWRNPHVKVTFCLKNRSHILADYNTSHILADYKTRVSSWLTIKPGSLAGWLQSHICFFLMENGSITGCHSTHVICIMTRGKYNQIPIDVWWMLGQQQDGREHIGLTLPPRCDGALPAATCCHKLTYIIFPTAKIAFSL